MCFNKNAIYSNCYPGFCNCCDQLRPSSCNPCCLIGLLQGMGNVQYNGYLVFLHFRNSPVIDKQVLVTECCTAFCKQYVIISRFTDFFDSELHCFRRKELSFFYVNVFTRFSGSNEELCLPAQKG